MFLLSVWKKLLNKHSISRYFETPWRSFDVAAMYWLASMVVAGAVYSRLMLFLWSVIECYQYSLWHYINLNLVPVSLKGTFVFWICIVITDDKSALVRQMAWYRQATNHYLITWTNVDNDSWRHIASLSLNRLTNCGSVTPWDDSFESILPDGTKPLSEPMLTYQYYQ